MAKLTFQNCVDIGKENGIIVEQAQRGKYTATWNNPKGEIKACCDSVQELFIDLLDLSAQKKDFEKEKQKEQEKFEKAVAEAFEKHKSRIGNNWYSDEVIDENHAEDFCKTFMELMNKA